MLERYFKIPAHLQSLRDDPLGDSFESLAQELCDKGYTQFTICGYLHAARRFLEWARRNGVPTESFDDAVVERFKRHLRPLPYGHNYRTALLHGANLFLAQLRRTGLIPAVDGPTDPVLVAAFCRWMQQQRGSCDSTLQIYRRPILDLLKTVGEDPVRLDAQSLRQFVLHRRSRGVVAVQTCTTALRAFCHFLSTEGRCSRDLVAAIPKIARWRLSSLPRYLSCEDVERVIDVHAADSPMGRRDRAILLLLARLGLRAGDIAQLQLADINWEQGRITVSGKSRRQSHLPLTQELGQALAAYIQDGRARTEATTVFVRACAPFRAFASHQAVTHIVDRALQRAGVIRPSRGAAHLLRHSLATNLLRTGTSLQDIAEVLRHKSVNTTQIYAKVDVRALQPLAQPWPGAPPC
jgi:integrase/recombinase XerD